FYSKTFFTGDNRWGDFSSTVVDPRNDVDMWTLQEYAGPNPFPTNLLFFDQGQWATWWGRLDVLGANSNQIIFSSSTYTVDENTPGFARMTIVNPAGLPGSVDYSTQGGTAVAGTDYESTYELPASGTMTFAAGETSKNFSFRIYDNSV